MSNRNHPTYENPIIDTRGEIVIDLQDGSATSFMRRVLRLAIEDGQRKRPDQRTARERIVDGWHGVRYPDSDRTVAALKSGAFMMQLTHGPKSNKDSLIVEGIKYSVEEGLEETAHQTLGLIIEDPSSYEPRTWYKQPTGVFLPAQESQGSAAARALEYDLLNERLAKLERQEYPFDITFIGGLVRQ